MRIKQATLTRVGIDMTIYTNHPYEVITVESPSTDMRSITVYGVKNISTGVVEAYIGELPKAMSMADALAHELKTHDPKSYSKKAAEYERSGGLAGMLARAAGGDDDQGPTGFTFNG